MDTTRNSHILSLNSTYWDAQRDDLFNAIDDHVIYVKDSFTLEISASELNTRIAEILRQMKQFSSITIRSWTNFETYIHFEVDGAKAGIIYVQNANLEILSSGRACYSIAIYGRRDVSLEILRELQGQFSRETFATITWWFTSRSGTQQRSVVIDRPKPVYDAFYPWVKGGIDNYFSQYFASDASILFMMGPPGTGKTSLIRHVIYHNQIAAIVTYDEELLSTDELFVHFLTSSPASLLVIEDADLMIGSREHGGNKQISRFLNISDGLVKFSDKKIIFTTNLETFNSIDPALIRPGRCFGALTFRPLTHTKSIAAAKAAGLSIPFGQKERTLAQLFNREIKSATINQRVGF